MATTSSRTRSSGPVLQKSNGFHGFHRSTSPSGRFCSSTMSSSATAFASSSSSFSSSATGFFNRSASTTMSSSSPQSQSVRFAIERPTSPSRSIAVSPRNQVVKKQTSNTPKRTCMCSPTNHPGSFRCSLHKNTNHNVNNTVSCSSNRLNARRSAMTNSLVRIGTVEGDWVKRALAALIRPSSHQQKRREGFQSRPSRLSVMSK